ncbi:MAG: hypothetical protein HUJ56_08140 [Erysipelotrichaceae bacterium]|nr:hypothetical protein [Erysipelotrichaceae bacterium]
METSLKMLKMLYDEGVTYVVLTPHHRHGYACEKTEILDQRFDELLSQVEQVLPRMQVYLGSEVHYASNIVEELNQEMAITMNGTQYVLTEFKPQTSYNDMKATLVNLSLSGYKPIIAHAERYECLLKDPVLVQDLVEMGYFVQLNTGSISGTYGFKVKKFCDKLLAYELVHFLGSDAHDLDKRKPEYEKAIKHIRKKFGEEYATKISYTNPIRMLAGKEI